MSIPINDYPYTDQHEMNLDYVLAEMKRLQEEIDALDERVTALGG